MLIEIWSDVVCPWCYLGKRRLERALAEVGRPFEIVYRSFELDPSAPKVFEGTLDELLAKKYRVSAERAKQMHARMTELGEAEGIDYRFDRARTGNTFDAHRLLHLARARGVQSELKERLMRGYFTEGAAIGDPQDLVRMGKDVGLDEELARATLAGDAFATEVRADEARARELGVDGVPAFLIDARIAIVGAQTSEVMLQALRAA